MPSYTDVELQEIARWLREGLSASRIAAKFSVLRGGPVSRNAIIGIVHRNAMLGEIGFANGRATPSIAMHAAGDRARREPAKALAHGRAGKGKADFATGAPASKLNGAEKRQPVQARQPRRLPVREAGVLIADGLVYRLRVPPPRREPIGRQPHGVAMRFIDCLFGRCRAPLYLTMEDERETHEPGGRPGADMLCCGMRTRSLKSYCAYHQARFQRRVFEAKPG
ncbi:GcrA family cell cycle regulator [Mesorhizobium sp. ES1-1]|uniref:GcrA family cell cycle regulator n=1 Tax=Mesorhizobium sp. ES1-1 TaxID=2876629 RepID=UPI001CC9E17A|nr:GcrA family cell cycle regulator [Mesorhizobium sp. ES1-1]MBZ9676407.1 GcrA cell cycle regulator [Mesorhizobium sp. ES1-1]